MKYVKCFLFLVIFSYFSWNVMFAIESEASNMQSETVQVAGSYPVEVEVLNEQGEYVKQTFFVTVTTKRTNVSEQFSEGIDAHDIKVPKGMFQNLDDKTLIALSKAKAWDTRNNYAIPLKVKQKRITDRQLGIGEITFSTERGTETTIQIIDDIKTAGTDMEVSSMYVEPFRMKQSVIIAGGAILVVLSFSPIVLILNFYMLKKKMNDIRLLLYRKDNNDVL